MLCACALYTGSHTSIIHIHALPLVCMGLHAWSGLLLHDDELRGMEELALPHKTAPNVDIIYLKRLTAFSCMC